MTGEILTEQIIHQTGDKKIKKILLSSRYLTLSPPGLVAVNAVGEGRDVLAAELKVFGSEDQDHEHREQGQGNWKSCLFLRRNKLINSLVYQ